VAAQGVKKEQIAGISTFARLDTTIACGGATSVDAIQQWGTVNTPRGHCGARTKEQ
jgi:hypothetical protein